MNESWIFDEPNFVVPGAVGEPGQRLFFIYAQQEGIVRWFKVEKQQVAALCDYLDGILADLPTMPAPSIEPIGSIAPTDIEWAIGRLQIGFEASDEKVVIVAEELIEIDEEMAGQIDFNDPDMFSQLGFEPATVQFRLSPAQVATFVAVGNDIVKSGRPSCPFCRRPKDASGHACPRMN